MLRPFRLLMLATLAFGIYMGFFAVPGSQPGLAAFDPETVAKHETDVWRSAEAGEEFAIFPSLTLKLREQHRYSWFRAAQASYFLSRATYQFVGMTNRFERVLPDLERAAAVERAWRDAEFDPAAAARAQLTWWVTAKVPNLSQTDDIAALVAEDYAVRYGRPAGDFLAAARYQAEAARVREQSEADPDWPGIEKLLIESYRALQATLEQPVRTRAR
jgi:hypothetical protein